MIGTAVLPHEQENVIRLLKRFVSGGERSQQFAMEIQTAFNDTYPDDERFVDLLHVFESHALGEADSSFDEATMVQECTWALAELESEVRRGDTQGI